jgi:hypothetical protein
MSSPFLSDQETKVDLLNNEAIAVAIIQIIRERSDNPVTIGIHGDWGAGKSSVLEMVEAGLTGEKDVLCLKFNGWRFQGFEDAKIALLDGIVSGLVERRPGLTKAADKVKAVVRRINWMKVARKAGSLAVTAFSGIPSLDQIQLLASGIGSLLADPAKLATKENLTALQEQTKSLLKPDDGSKNLPEEVSAFHKAFDDLLDAADVKRLVVLMDDLDRCLPDTVIETLEAIRLFVFTSRTAFVVAADEEMIEYSVRRHFPDLKNTTGPQSYARNYLEKLIQIPFRIPALGDNETRVYVALLLIGAELGEDDPEFKRLITEARDLLRRPWIGGDLDLATVKKVLGDKFSLAQNALILTDQIGPILASGTKGNPRQIKRFLNAVALRRRIADARGFGDEVKIPILTKLMLAERFLLRTFDQIAIAAAASPKGTCEDLNLLELSLSKGSENIESSHRPGTRPKSNSTSEVSPSGEVEEPLRRKILDEWLSSPSVCEWARVQPPLAGIDLRPYLFVAKDRKDYFGPSSILGHLAVVAERLFGPKIVVQSMESDLKLLAEQEAKQVFEVVRTRIISGDTFDNQPAGIDGLTVLVKAHPDLQDNLLDFLEELPPDRLGPWAVSGWQSIIRDSGGITRLSSLLKSWATSSNPLLKASALNAIKVLTKGH